ncbi:hypothetical protein L3Q82_007829 [Scortum barcoo]|uniref:Uncharacterized protein n=1 Tax=Scortum barcoo TaxID=214431 RepID=A0ACB8WKP2_9TELE|nr:hypothetical protein L3Q82_007829 [Scortum barcoo]
MCFVDLEKAFDRVPRGILWGVLREYGVRGPLLRAVRSLYDRSRSLVRIAGNDVVLLASSSQDLQHVLERFAAECEAAGMRISTSKSEAMVLDRKRVACPLRVGGEVLPQVEEFKYLGVLFTSEGKMEREIDRRIGAASAVMRSVYRTVVVKKELSRKAKLSIYRSIYAPTLTYGHELWVMTERTRSRIQAAEMSFLRRVAGRSLRDRVRSSVTREELGVEPLLPLRRCIERSQLRWLGHLFRMPPGRLPREVFQGPRCPMARGRRPREDLGGHAGETMSLGWPGNAWDPPGRAGGSVWDQLKMSQTNPNKPGLFGFSFNPLIYMCNMLPIKLFSDQQIRRKFVHMDPSLPDALNNFYARFDDPNTSPSTRFTPPPGEEPLRVTAAEVRRTLPED